MQKELNLKMLDSESLLGDKNGMVDVYDEHAQFVDTIPLSSAKRAVNCGYYYVETTSDIVKRTHRHEVVWQ